MPVRIFTSRHAREQAARQATLEVWQRPVSATAAGPTAAEAAEATTAAPEATTAAPEATTTAAATTADAAAALAEAGTTAQATFRVFPFAHLFWGVLGRVSLGRTAATNQSPGLRCCSGQKHS